MWAVTSWMWKGKGVGILCITEEEEYKVLMLSMSFDVLLDGFESTTEGKGRCRKGEIEKWEMHTSFAKRRDVQLSVQVAPFRFIVLHAFCARCCALHTKVV